MNPPQPSTPQAAASGETIDQLIDRLVSTHEILNLTPKAREEIAAAVQAAQVKTLDYVEQQIIGKDPATQRRKLMAVRALLDGERRK